MNKLSKIQSIIFITFLVVMSVVATVWVSSDNSSEAANVVNTAKIPVKLAAIYEKYLNANTREYLPDQDYTSNYNFNVLINNREQDSWISTMKQNGFSGTTLQYFAADELEGPRGLSSDDAQNITCERNGINTFEEFDTNSATFTADEFCLIHNSIVTAQEFDHDLQQQTPPVRASKDWFLLDSNGNRLISTSGAYLINPSNKDAREFIVGRMLWQLGLRQNSNVTNQKYSPEYVFDGIFLDNVHLSMSVLRNMGQPSNVTEELYRLGMISLAGELKEAISIEAPDKKLFANLVGGKDEKWRWDPYKTLLDGAFHEDFSLNWGRGPHTPDTLASQLLIASDWINNNKQWISVSQGGNRQTGADGCSTASLRDNESLLRYSLAATLLVTDGNNASYHYTDYKCMYDTFREMPEYSYRLGDPVEPFRIVKYSGSTPIAFERTFQCGKVTLNSQTHNGSIDYDPKCQGTSSLSSIEPVKTFLGIRNPFVGGISTSQVEDANQKPAVLAAANCSYDFASPVVGERVGVQDQIKELSGLGRASNPNYVWLHNDGEDMRLFLTDMWTGDIKATWSFSNARVKDYEDMASGVTNGVRYLYMGGFGNSPSSNPLNIVRIVEPSNTSSGGTISSSNMVQYQVTRPNNTYSNESNSDMEAMFVEASTGDVYLVPKQSTTEGNGERYIYRLSKAQMDANPNNSTPLTVQQSPSRTNLRSSVTDGANQLKFTGADLSEDGQYLIMRTYGDVFVWERQTGESIFSMAARTPDHVLANHSSWQSTTDNPNYLLEAVLWLDAFDALLVSTERNSSGEPPLIFYKHCNNGSIPGISGSPIPTSGATPTPTPTPIPTSSWTPGPIDKGTGSNRIIFQAVGKEITGTATTAPFPSVSVEINGVVPTNATFDIQGTASEYDSNSYINYTFRTNNPINLENVRLLFTNNRDGNGNRDVKVGNVTIVSEGNTVVSNAAAATAVGHWTLEGGCNTAITGVNALHCDNAYFDFSTAVQPTPIPTVTSTPIPTSATPTPTPTPTSTPIPSTTGSPQHGELITITPSKVNGILTNPMSGLYKWRGKELAPLQEQSLDAYERYEWRDLEPSINNYDFSIIRNDMNRANAEGREFAFRVRDMVGYGVGPQIPSYLEPYGSYENGTFIPDWNNSYYRERKRALIRALGEEFNNDAKISWVEVGLYGQYGEWTVGSSYTQATEATKNEIIDSYVAAFPDVQLIMKLERSALNSIVYAFSKQHKFPIGMRFDVLGHTSWFDQWTNRPADFAKVNTRWQVAPFLSEYGNVNDPISLSLAIQHAKDYHVLNSGNGNYANSWNDLSQGDKDLIYEAAETLGYRYRVKDISLPSQIAKGVPFNVTANWLNEGVTPTYEPWDVMIQLRNADVNNDYVVWSQKSSLNLRTLLPTNGSPSLVVDQFTIPDDVPVGTYNLNVLVKDPRGHRRPMQLGMNGLTPQGCYPVGQIEILPSANIDEYEGVSQNRVPAGADYEIELTPVSDTYVRNTTLNRGTNYGSDTKMTIDASPEDAAFIKFDLSDYQDLSQDFDYAYLSYRVGDGTLDGSNDEHIIRVAGPGAYPWLESGEGGLTYENMSNYGNNKIVKVNGANSNQLIQANVSSAVSNKLGTEITFVLNQSDGRDDGLSIFTKESAFSPKLVLGFANSPIGGCPGCSTNPNGPDYVITYLSPVEDSYTSSSSSNANYGTATELNVDGSPEDTTYVKFDKSQLPDNTRIISAKLELSVVDSLLSGGATDVSAYAVSDNLWGETTINHGNKPNTSLLLSTLSSTVSEGSTIVFDVLNGVSDTSDIMSFAIKTPQSNGISVHSRESLNPPQLVLIHTNTEDQNPSVVYYDDSNNKVRIFEPNEDTYVISSNPDSSYSTSETLEIDGSPEAISYMKFDTSVLDGSNILYAKLQYKVTDTLLSGTDNYHKISSVLPDSWNSATTFNTKPTLASSNIVAPGGDRGQCLEADITNLLASSQQELGAMISIGFSQENIVASILKPVYAQTQEIPAQSGDNGLQIHSKESLYSPQLIVAYNDLQAPPLAVVSPTPTPTPTPTPSSSPAATPLPTTTPTSTPTPTPSPTQTLVGSNTPVTTVNNDGTSTSTFVAIEDTYVEQTNPGSNFGANTSLVIDLDPQSIAYMKFDTSFVTHTRAVKEAKLRYRVQYGNNSGTTNTHLVSTLGSSGWSETGTTYNNRPTINASFAEVAPLAEGTFIEVDVTSTVNQYLGSVLSWALSPTGNDGLRLYSRETENPPQLIVTYDSLPSGQ